ncbi:MAG: glycine--tRNA ligase subunit beta [Sodalis sp. Fle]|nr:MAG: glycine--tRNA ligase subunit beta [Sodalis sp. Fle]
MTQHTFLVEIGTEELPAKALRALGQTFAANINTKFDNANIPHGKISWFATPRRLAVKVDALSNTQADNNVKKRGPSVAQAFDAEGKPTKAAKGWARKCGITLNQAEYLTSNKGKWLIYRTCIHGQQVQTLLCNVVNNALNELPASKMMRWGDKDTKFIRPVHTATLLLDDQIIFGRVLGIDINRIVRGHRFMGEAQIKLDHANSYPQVLLERGQVIADYALRKEIIRRDVESAARKIGGIADLTDNLLEEVTSLVEWPVVLTAHFEEKFLALPKEALIYTMKEHQKYFPIYGTDGKLLPYFIFVANILSQDIQKIIAGNEKVMHSRMADAEFFFNTDRKQRLEDHLPRLNNVLFQEQLGTLLDKSDRIKSLAGWIAAQIGTDVNQAERAGLLSKCDLMTNMVFEFPNTQGVIGMHYAHHDGEPEAVALAQKEQYRPRFAGDELPTTLVSCAVAIAEKMDTLVGIFSIGQHPKRDKDPFALRRAAIGVLRIIVEKQLPLDLQTLTQETTCLYGNKLTNAPVIDFMLGRFRAWYQSQGYSVDTIQAVLARRPTRPTDFDARVRAVTYFRTLEEAASLAATNKRVSNILAKSSDPLGQQVQNALLKEQAEINLATYMVVLRKILQPLFETARYQDALVELATLHKPVNAFFDSVMVMDENRDVRINRLTLLNQLRNLFLQVADISLLQ